MKLNGYALREIRSRSGRTVTDCAKAIGVKQPTWSNWELGVRDATPTNLIAIVATLEIADFRAILANPADVDMTELAA